MLIALRHFEEAGYQGKNSLRGIFCTDFQNKLHVNVSRRTFTKQIDESFLSQENQILMKKS